MYGRCLVTILIVCGTLPSVGCVIESPLSVQRFWFDRNSYSAPSIVYDRITHQPMRSHRVNELRWMYNLGPHDTDEYALMPKGVHPATVEPPVPPPATYKHPPQPQIKPPPNNGPLVPPAPNINQRRPTPDPHAPVASKPVPRTADSQGWRFTR